MGENIFKYIFTTIFCGGGEGVGGGGVWVENIFEYIFSTVLWGEKLFLNIFSPPYFGGENIFKYIFSRPL